MVERGIQRFLKKQGYDKIELRVGMAALMLFIILIAFTFWFLVFNAKPCANSECFVKAIEDCKRVSWVKDDSQARWRYIVLGGEGDDKCRVEVRLLEMKQGTIDSERLQNKEMVCIVSKGDSQTIEEDVSKCSGVLKGELQDIIIQRMHNYLLENIGEIREEFVSV